MEALKTEMTNKEAENQVKLEAETTKLRSEIENLEKVSQLIGFISYMSF